MFKIVTPQSDEELAAYYHFRWQYLRQPWNFPPGSEKDEYEQVSEHRVVVNNNGDIVACGRVHLNTAEEAQIRHIAVHSDYQRRGPHEAIDFYTQAGLSEKQIKNYIERFGFFGSIIHKLPDAYNRIKHGDVISIAGDEWECIEGRGHTMEHICLFSKSKNLLISGDQLLPKITSHVGVFPTEPNANPLDDWLESCKRLIDLVPEDVLVLPAHGRPFLGAHKRLKTIINHHEESLNKLEEFLTTPKRSVDVFPVLFKREIDDGNFLMATGESIAHLNCLIERGLVSRNISEGIAFYERV